MVTLKPYESKVVSFTVDAKMLAFYTANNVWEAESGNFKIFVGGSSDNTLEAEIIFNN
jgi:beta-glucosidase